MLNSILNSSSLYRDIIILYKLLGTIIKYFIKIIGCMSTTLYYYWLYYTDFLVIPRLHLNKANSILPTITKIAMYKC